MTRPADGEDDTVLGHGDSRKHSTTRRTDPFESVSTPKAARIHHDSIPGAQGLPSFVDDQFEPTRVDAPRCRRDFVFAWGGYTG